MKYIVASHGKLASAFQDTVEMLTQYKELYAICAYCEEEFPENLYKLIEKFPEEEIIIFADVFGGSVCREALELIQENERIHVVAGINLPLILEAVMGNATEKDLDTLVEKAKEQIVHVKMD